MTYHFTRLLLVVGLALFLVREGTGQGLNCENNNGAFSISQTLGCDSVITVTNRLQGAVNVEFYFDFNGRTLNEDNRVTADANGNATFTYKRPDRFTILQIGSINGEGFAYCAEIEIINTQSPVAWLSSCSSGEVRIEFADFETNTQYDRLGINWGDNTAPEYINKGSPLSRSHVYQRNGEFPVSVFGVYNRANCNAGRPLELGSFVVGSNTDFERLLINRVEVLETGEITTSFTNNNGSVATLQVKTGSGTYQNTGATIQTDGNHTLVIPDLAAANEQNIRLLIEDQCQNRLEQNEMTVVHLQVSSQGEENLITWSRNLVTDEFDRYELYKDNQLLSTFRSINETTYTDGPVTCGDEHTYKVIAYQIHADIGEITSHSRPVSISGSNTRPDPLMFLSASVENNVIVLNTALATPVHDDYKIIVEKSDGGSFHELATVSNQLTYVDQQVNPNTGSYCYQAIFENTCGSKSDPTPAVCSIYLSAQDTELRWTSESPFTENPDTWSIEKAINGQIQQENTGTHNTYSVQGDILLDGRPAYRIIAATADGAVSFSNLVQYQKGAELYIPTAFSPNNDTHNDVFLPVGQIYDDFSMTIFDRWGKPIYNTRKPDEGWNGKIEDEDAPPGNYTYRIEIRNTSETIYRKSGTFLLIR